MRIIPFIFNELQSYVMCFFTHTNGDKMLCWFLTTTEDVDGILLDTGVPVTLTLPAAWDIDLFDYAQSGDEMYISQSGLAPHIIRRDSDVAWSLILVVFTDQPTDWSDLNGWPEKVSFHQQRLAFGANTLKRQTIWLSKAGDFSDFGISSPFVDSDAVSFTLDSGTQNKIKWMVSGKSLHVGTLGNEWTVSGNDRASLTPTNILAQRQTNNGSEPTKPLLVGLTTLFIEKHGRTVNEFVYDYTYDNYKTSDMAILSPHLTENFSITDWTYQQTPNSVIWSIREDGVMLGITYQRQHKVVGWHQHDTQGQFYRTTTIPGQTREDDLWVLTKREVDGSMVAYVEKMGDELKSLDAMDARFLDSYLTYEGAPAQEISGLEHLEGLEVDILADGTVHPPEVVESGSVTLNKEYSTVVVGLGYVSELRPNLTDIPDNAGTSLGREQRITSLTIDFYKSLGCFIGVDNAEDGERVEEKPFRVPTDLMGVAVPLFSGWVDYDFFEGFDKKSEYFVRQLQPLPMIVRAVVDNVKVNDK